MKLKIYFISSFWLNLFEYIVGYVYIPWDSRLDRQPSKREVVGSSPAVGRNFSFCNSRFLRMAHISNQPIQMKSTVTFT